jgi:hypothetical protein
MPYPAFTELDSLHRLIEENRGALRAEIVATVQVEDNVLPIWCLETGSSDLRAPAIGFFGGVHGMERIGTQVLIAWLQTVLARLRWDSHFGDLLQGVRLVFMPMVNPGGLALGTRANPDGVDLMRAAPVEADTRVPFLVGGHRLGPQLPWYRGRVEDPLPAEAEALFEVVRARLHPHPFSLAMDCHSGFGFRDRIWFPYARSREPVPNLPEAFAIRALFNATYPNHSFYLMEPQSLSYTTHGDLWDFPLRRASRPLSRRLPALHPGDGLLAVGEEESAPALLLVRPLQSHPAAPPAARAAPPPHPLRFPAAPRRQPPAVAAHGIAARALSRGSVAALVRKKLIAPTPTMGDFLQPRAGVKGRMPSVTATQGRPTGCQPGKRRQQGSCTARKLANTDVGTGDKAKSPPECGLCAFWGLGGGGD